MRRPRVLDPPASAIRKFHREVEMTRLLTKLVLCALALATAVELARYRRRHLEKQAGKDALLTWEHEGGSVTSPD
jgi:hypothetical protein